MSCNSASENDDIPHMDAGSINLKDTSIANFKCIVSRKIPPPAY